MSILRRMIDEKHSLKDMALLVRRAGLEHLVTDVDEEELRALADAGDELHLEFAAVIVKSLQNPGQALARFDGGATARAETKAAAYAKSRGAS